MSTNTTRTPIYAERRSKLPIVRFLSFWIVRPQALVLAVEAGLTGVVVGVSALGIKHSMLAIEPAIAVVLGLEGAYTVLHLAGIGRTIVDADSKHFIRGVLRSLVSGIAVTAVLLAALPAFRTVSIVGLVSWLSAIALVASLRPMLRRLIRNQRLIETFMILGPDEMTERVYRELAAGQDVVPQRQSSQDPGEPRNQQRVTRIVVTDPRMATRESLTTLIDSKLRGMKIEQAVESCENMCGKIWLAGLQPEWWIYCGGFVPTFPCRFLKHTLDITGAILLILITWPLFVVTAAAIKLTSPGPVFYRQDRVGRHGRLFEVLKFRSMCVDAEAETGPTWVARNDKRVTPVGRIMRKFRIDELPQLYNVLKGDMSFVGPRPERLHFVELLRRELPYYDLRHYVRPGVTGWAQVRYPYGASIADAYEKLQYDLYYVKHMSLLLDITIMLKTIKVILSGGGR